MKRKYSNKFIQILKYSDSVLPPFDELTGRLASYQVFWFWVLSAFADTGAAVAAYFIACQTLIFIADLPGHTTGSVIYSISHAQRQLEFPTTGRQLSHA